MDSISFNRINCFLFCLAILSINFPIKIYPVVFVIASISFLIQSSPIQLRPWSLCLLCYSIYAITIFIITGQFDELRVINFYKIIVNFLFLFSSICWLKINNDSKLITWVDRSLHVTFVLILLQLLAYHQASGFQFIAGGDTSNDGNSIYDLSKYFWGLDNKNLFGARIATLGFPYILLGVIRNGKISIFRIGFILFLAFISMSRTPILALLVGVLLLLWNIPKKYLKVALVTIILVSLPYILNKALRINNITDTDDGMGVRLVYWQSMFKNLDQISIFGNGFQAANEFLPRYSPIYTGEPNIHNTFLNNYLDFGIFGLIFYVLFLYYFYKYCYRQFNDRTFWLISFSPLITVMMLLFPGYDNDIVVYLILIFMIGKSQIFDAKTLTYGV